MLRSIKEVEKINQFVEVRIPKASILFMKYGEKLSGNYGTSATELDTPVKVNSGSVISQMTHAQNLLEDTEV